MIAATSEVVTTKCAGSKRSGMDTATVATMIKRGIAHVIATTEFGHRKWSGMNIVATVAKRGTATIAIDRATAATAATIVSPYGPRQRAVGVGLIGAGTGAAVGGLAGGAATGFWLAAA